MTALAAARVRLGVALPAMPVVFASSVAFVTTSAVLAYLLPPETGNQLDAVQQDAAVVIALGLLARAAARERGPVRVLAVAFGSSFLIGGLGVLAWALQPDSAAAPILTNLSFVVAAALIVGPVGWAFGRELDRSTSLTVVLDATVLFFGVGTVVLTIWRPDLRGVLHAQELPAIAGALALVAGSLLGWVNLLTRQVTPGARGPWAIIDGSLMLGLGWLSWLDLASRGQSTSVIMPGDLLLSLGVLLLAYGTATWGDAGRPSRGFERFATRGRDLFPVIAAVGSVTLQLVVRDAPPASAALTLGVILAVAARTWLLLRSERLAAARLADATRERADTLVSSSRLQAGDTPEETAERVCIEALHLREIDAALVLVPGRDGTLAVLAVAGPDRIADEIAHVAIPAPEAAHLLARAAAGPWAQSIAPHDGDGQAAAFHALGLRGFAAAPLLWDDRVIGLIALVSCSSDIASTLVDRLQTVHEFAVVAGALLGPGLAVRDRRDQARDEIASVIADQSFSPVFQPIVELGTGRTVGFEALTRFDDRARPDIRFGEAALAGMSVALEMATIRAALDAASLLPEGWLSLNVSPDLAAALLPLTAALEGASRPVTLEITEHVPITDYGKLVNSLGTLRPGLRIAVDDAGAGYAGLRHILELQPDFVKLDIGLVHSVDTDAARRAMVASMVTFARDTGCRLIAEGIETPAELRVLRDLGVELGQGFHLARPAPADDHAPDTRRAAMRAGLLPSKRVVVAIR